MAEVGEGGERVRREEEGEDVARAIAAIAAIRRAEAGVERDTEGGGKVLEDWHGSLAMQKVGIGTGMKTT